MRVPNSLVFRVVVPLAVAAVASGASRSGTWLAATTLSGIGGSQPRVAVDRAGNTLVAWAKDAGTGDGVVEIAAKPAGQPFGPSQIVSAPGLWSGPDLGVDAAGKTTLLWATGSPPQVIVRVATRASTASAFGSPATLDGPHSLIFSPRLAVSRRGDAVAAWIATDSSLEELSASGRYDKPFVVRTACRPPGGRYGAATDVYTTDADTPPTFDLAIDDRGDAAIVLATSWRRGTRIDAFYRRAGATFGPARRLAGASDATNSKTRFRFVDAPEVAMSAQGAVLAAWVGLDATSVLRASYRTPGGAWKSPVDVGASATCCNTAYRIAFDRQHRALAVWIASRFAASGERVDSVQMSTRASGGAWARPRVLSTPDVPIAIVRPALAVGANGSVGVAWMNRAATVPTISAVVRPAGGAFGPVQGVTNGPGYPLGLPQLALDKQGNAVAAWQTAASVLTKDTGLNRQWVEAAGYDGAGPLLRALRIPRSGVTGRALRFSVAPRDVWSEVAATHWSFGDGTDAAGTDSSHVYTHPGHYTVTVTSTDGLGNTTEATAVAVVR